VNILIPIAGRDRYFPEGQFVFPKPLVDICGTPLIEHTLYGLLGIAGQPRFTFVVQEEDCKSYSLDDVVRVVVGPPRTDIVQISAPTQGAICSCLMAIDHIDPDEELLIANGDHVYWDLRAGLAAQVTGRSPLGIRTAGTFDRAAPVLGTANEGVLKRAVGPQLAELYGTRLRGVPVFFLRDDHDYFEDDQVTPALTSFPPDAFMIELARATQRLYYPELLPDPTRPLDLPGSDAADRPPGASEAFGTLRWGRLFEGLLYDCKGFMTLGTDAGLVPRAVEEWLHRRMRDSDAAHVVHLPSNPPGWTAGKYAEWYRDVLGDDGRLTVDEPKPGWQPGWLAQHDRLLAAASAMDRVPLFVSGDIHSIAEGRILRSGRHDFGANPIVSLITGSPGTGVGWPSAARGTVATPSLDLDLETTVPVQEVNGFQLIDVEPEAITVRHFRWRRGVDPEAAIDTLEPFQVTVHAR
jgi:hypothetical protein